MQDYLILIAIGVAISAPKVALTDEIHGINSPYTEPVRSWARTWKRPERLKPGEQYRLQCLELKGNDSYIGARQEMEIGVSLSEAAKVLDDLSIYPKIFDDLVVAEERSRVGNQWLVFSEQHIGIPFVPNERNETLYWLDVNSPQRRVYRYQLKSSNHLKFSDGAIVLDSITPNLTMYSEVDFYDADWGIAKTFGKNRIWKDSLIGFVQADLAVKMKSEHPDWSNEDVLRQSKKISESVEVGSCLAAKTEFRPFQQSERR